MSWSPDDQQVRDTDHGHPLKLGVATVHEALMEAREWLETEDITVYDVSGAPDDHWYEVTLNADGTWTRTGNHVL